jgi:hypothetical protein
MDMFFHVASVEREIYWQLGNVTCSAYPLEYLDTIHSETGELQTKSALNLIVFGPKLEHLDLIEYVFIEFYLYPVHPSDMSLSTFCKPNGNRTFGPVSSASLAPSPFISASRRLPSLSDTTRSCSMTARPMKL